MRIGCRWWQVGFDTGIARLGDGSTGQAAEEDIARLRRLIQSLKGGHEPGLAPPVLNKALAKGRRND